MRMRVALVADPRKSTRVALARLTAPSLLVAPLDEEPVNPGIARLVAQRREGQLLHELSTCCRTARTSKGKP